MPQDLADTMTEVAERNGSREFLEMNTGSACLALLTHPANQRSLPHITLSAPSVGTAEDLYDPVMEIAESHGTCAQLGRRVISSIAILKQPAQQRSPCHLF